MPKSVWMLGLVAILFAGCVLPPAAPPQATSTFPPPAFPTPSTAATSTPGASPMMIFPDIPYEQVQGADPNLVNLDIYSPLRRDLDTPLPPNAYPVVVFIHGGSWRTGDKRGTGVASVQAPYFTSQGIIYISINYRLAPADKYPAQVEDVAAALAWACTYIGHYGGDTRQIYVMGHSAGGQLAALVATDERYLAAYGLKLDVIHGIILLDGVGLDIPALITSSSLSLFETDFGSDPKVWREASPLYHISPGKGIPPFLMFYAVENGEGQSTSQEMATALTAAGVENVLEAAQGRSHDTILNDIGTPGDPVTGRIMEFIQAAKP